MNALTKDQKKRLKKLNAHLKDKSIMGDEYGDGSDEHFTVDGKDSKGLVSKGKNCKD